jgi:hypothetical protein
MPALACGCPAKLPCDLKITASPDGEGIATDFQTSALFLSTGETISQARSSGRTSLPTLDAVTARAGAALTPRAKVRTITLNSAAKPRSRPASLPDTTDRPIIPDALLLPRAPTRPPVCGPELSLSTAFP